MKAKLTDRAVQAAKATAGRRDIPDGGCPGLRLRVTPQGGKSWAFVYKRDAKTRTQTLGTYPHVSLADARIAADELRAALKRGSDPSAVVAAKEAEAKRTTSTFNDVADQYVEHIKRRKSSWQNDQGYLKRPRKAWGNRTFAGITKADVVALLREIADDAPVSANRTQSVLRTMWGWAAEGDLIPSNFLAGLRKQGGREKAKDRVVADTEIQALWTALDDPDAPLERAVGLALKFVLLTCQRPGEVSGLRFDELRDLDGTAPVWELPAARAKNGRPNTVPLSAAAVAVIREAARLRNDEPEAVFASRFERLEAISRHSLSRAVLRLAERHGWKAPWTPHDLRRTGATIARTRGVERDAVQALLNHIDDDVTAIYDRADLLPGKRRAVEAIAEHVAAVTNDSLASD